MDSGRHGRGPPCSCHRAAPTAQLPPCSCALKTSTRWKFSELNYARGPPRANCAAPTVAVAHRHRCPPPPLPTATVNHRPVSTAAVAHCHRSCCPSSADRLRCGCPPRAGVRSSSPRPCRPHPRELGRGVRTGRLRSAGMTLRPHDLRPRTLYPSAWLLGEGMHQIGRAHV